MRNTSVKNASLFKSVVSDINTALSRTPPPTPRESSHYNTMPIVYPPDICFN